MEKNLNFRTAVCLGCSALLNLVFVSLLIRSNSQQSWSRKASAEAEAVASLSCSGHGRAYLDGLVLDNGKPVCECNACYTGPDCSQFVPGSVVDADSGNPIFLEPFWRQNAASSSILVAGWHRMGYEFDDGSLVSRELEKQIRKLHAAVGNAVTADRYIVFGAGSTQLLNAAVYALSSDDGSSPPTKVVASTPYYPVYKSQTELFQSANYEFSGDTISWMKDSNSSMNFIEFVTSPNNPNGQLKKAVLQGPFAKQIHDLAYYWPHYTPIPSPVDEDLMLFTLSKLTGHAGSRFGWALIKDKAVYERMVNYMDLNTYGVPRETQLRALKLLNVVLEGNGRKMFNFGHEAMKYRWEKLTKTFAASERFSIEELELKYCSFSKEVRAPTPAFAWIKCNEQEDKDCHAALSAAKIIGRKGPAFGSDSSYVRLSLVKSQDDFDLLQHRLEMLVFEERAAKLKAKFMSEESKTRNKNNSISHATNIWDQEISIHFNQELASHERESLQMQQKMQTIYQQ